MSKKVALMTRGCHGRNVILHGVVRGPQRSSGPWEEACVIQEPLDTSIKLRHKDP